MFLFALRVSFEMEFVNSSLSFQIITNMKRIDYLTALKYSKVLLGNSSSGIIEAASFNLPVINLGTRQRNRERNKNVIDSKITSDEITLLTEQEENLY